MAISLLIVVLYCRRFVERREEGRRQGVVLSPALQLRAVGSLRYNAASVPPLQTSHLMKG